MPVSRRGGTETRRTVAATREHIANARRDCENSILSPDGRDAIITDYVRDCLEPYYGDLAGDERNDYFVLWCRASYLLGQTPSVEQWSRIINYTVLAAYAPRGRQLYAALMERYVTLYGIDDSHNPYTTGASVPRNVQFRVAADARYIGPDTPITGRRASFMTMDDPIIDDTRNRVPLQPQVTLDFETNALNLNSESLTALQREMQAQMASMTSAMMGVGAAPPTEAIPPAPTVAPPHVPRGDWDCHECGESFNGDDAHAPMHAESDAHGRDVCMPCADDSGRYYQMSNGRYATDDETAACYACDAIVFSHETTEVDGETVCDRCMNRGRNVVFCVDDDAHHLRSNCYYDSASGDWYYDSDNIPADSAEDDDGEPADDDTLVYGYSTNVLAIKGRKAFVGGSSTATDMRAAPADKALLFGVELETGTKDGNDRNDIASAVLATTFNQYGICKADGTVTGPELVTLPADLASHRSVYQWREWCKALTPVATGYHAEDQSAGMHVHINRAAVSPYTAGKMLVFMNAEQNREWLEFIAQRSVSQNHYCKFKHDKRLTDAANGRVNDDRYEALNVTRHTIEVRIFRANLSEKRIFKNLEFCHALVKWCELESAQELTAERMQAYILANRADYPNLAKFIESQSEDK